MNFDIQPVLENDRAFLYPLKENDFEELYAVASDPEVWVQHPNKDRWKKDVFKTFFEGAMQSGGAFRVIDKATGRIAGCTRIYSYDESDNSILIGYTFYGREYWGSGLNHSVKTLMLDYLFPFVSRVYFHIGAVNIRSQVSITRLGAPKSGEEELAYFGEAPKPNYIYCIEKDEWVKMKNAAG
ncbi:MAG TPA: GNAT family N-acetyltransferase [Chitinophagaceae bacterium]